MDTVNYHDRSTEFWSFAPDMILDSKGNRTMDPRVFFHSGVINKRKDGTMLKV